MPKATKADLPIGEELENLGSEILRGFGLQCFNPREQAQLKDLDPGGPYSPGDHVEFDYFIPLGRFCLVGEMKGTQSANAKSAQSDYRTFREHYALIRRLLPMGEQLWRVLGIPDDALRYFQDVAELRGFFILPYLLRFDVHLRDATHMACLYKSDWDLIKVYKETLGKYAAPHLLTRLAVPPTRGIRPLEISEEHHGLMRIPHRRIASGNISPAHLFTFEVSPYDLLDIAQVFRRDELPDLTANPDPNFQRPLIPKKLDSIRRKLRETPDFMFPNNILVVLSKDCKYKPGDASGKSELKIPHVYGALSVIDGQHRLFAYADDSVRAHVPDTTRIMVTGIQFGEKNKGLISKFSAMTFVEINTSQAPIDSTLIDSIGYEILGDTRPRFLAAQVILRTNRRKQSTLYGLFHTNQTSSGMIAAATVITALQAITSTATIDRLATSKGSKLVKKRNGYLALFGVQSIEELTNPETLIERARGCLEKYFAQVKKVFNYDWPDTGPDETSSFQYARVIAGFVRLLNRFISDGLTWAQVTKELVQIRGNILKLRKMKKYNRVLFDPNHQHIPSSQSSDNDDFNFLENNRRKPTSILDIGHTTQTKRTRAR